MDDGQSRELTRVIDPDTDNETTETATIHLPRTAAPRTLYTVTEGRVDNLISAGSDDELGRRMIALGRSLRRGWFARLTSRRQDT